MTLAALLTVVWGGLVTADSAAFLQVLVSQPLVAGAVTGLVWGRTDLGLELGAILQLFACAALPLGGRAPDDHGTGAVVGTALACALSRLVPAAGPGAPLLYGIGVAFLVALGGRSLTVWMRRRNEAVARWVEAELRAGRLAALSQAQWAGVGQAFALGAAFTGAGLAVFGILGRVLLAGDGLAFARAWHVGSPWLWGFGAGLATRGLTAGRRPGILFWIALVVFLTVRLWSEP